MEDKGSSIGRIVYRIDGVVQEGWSQTIGIPGREPMVTRVELPSGKRSRVEVSVFDASGKFSVEPNVQLFLSWHDPSFRQEVPELSHREVKGGLQNHPWF